jgi:hypothetical protein
MFTVLKLLLIVLSITPQGCCCFVRIASTIFVATKSDELGCCCCQSGKQSEKNPSQAKSLSQTKERNSTNPIQKPCCPVSSNSSECGCRHVNLVNPKEVQFDSTGLETVAAWPIQTNVSPAIDTWVSRETRVSIRRQILHCSWQC